MSGPGDAVRGQSRVRTPVRPVLGSKYKIVRPLGEGGMGAVFEAVNTWTQRRVAVKVLRPEFAVRPDVVERFRREARTATHIQHPNIVDVLDMDVDPSDGSLFIVQEFLHGTDLRHVLNTESRLPARDALDVVVPIMGALVAAHRRGVLHRDIKPENIFLVRAPGGMVPKLIDFGISKVVGAAAPSTKVTFEGSAVGTIDYMSPEQMRGELDLDGRTDVWSVGVVLFEALAGRVPFDAPTANVVIARVLTERAPPLDRYVPGAPRALTEAVATALEPDRAKRFPTMRAFLEAVLESPLEHGETTRSVIAPRHAASIADLDAADDALAVSFVATAPDGDHDGDPLGESPTNLLEPAPQGLSAGEGLAASRALDVHALRPRVPRRALAVAAAAGAAALALLGVLALVRTARPGPSPAAGAAPVAPIAPPAGPPAAPPPPPLPSIAAPAPRVNAAPAPATARARTAASHPPPRGGVSSTARSQSSPRPVRPLAPARRSPSDPDEPVLPIIRPH